MPELNDLVQRRLSGYYHPEYFPSKAHEKIFALLELDGSARSKLLGLTFAHSCNKQLCREHIQRLRECVLESGHMHAERALVSLARIEKSML